LEISEGGLEFHPGVEPVFLNDVELKDSLALRPGDQLSTGDATYLVLPASPEHLPPVSRLRHAAFIERLGEEASADVEVAIVLARSTAFQWLRPDEILAGLRLAGRRPLFAHPTPDLLEVLILLEPSSSIELLKQRLVNATKQTDETIRWGVAHFPRDGGTPEELWSAAIDRLLGLDVPPSDEIRFADPSMIRLWSLTEAVARLTRPLILIGEQGVGRETFARRVRTLGAPGAPFVVHGAAVFDRRRFEQDVARASGGALHLRHPNMLPETDLSALLSATKFLPSVAFTSDEDRPRRENEIFVPSLRDRPGDVAIIAEDVLHLLDTRLGRRRSFLRAEARQSLQTLLGRENVRSLRNGVVRAALKLSGAELRAEHLEEPEDPIGVGVENLRQRLDDTERRALEEALRQTRWNVSEASRLMRLPRRTVVYRMRRLGVRRPTSIP
jgi:hypothetical protein